MLALLIKRIIWAGFQSTKQASSHWIISCLWKASWQNSMAWKLHPKALQLDWRSSFRSQLQRSLFLLTTTSATSLPINWEAFAIELRQGEPKQESYLHIHLWSLSFNLLYIHFKCFVQVVSRRNNKVDWLTLSSLVKGVNLRLGT